MKNEGPYLLEWLAFHRAIGFDRFLIFTNDCEDGSDQMADRLAELGIIEHHRNDDYQKRGPQWTALNSQPLRKALRQARWACHLDIDEFLNIKTGTGLLSDLIDETGHIDAISIPWRFFGNAGVFDLIDAPVTGQFTQCGPYPIMFPRQALMFKTLFRPSDKFNRPGVHAPRLAKGLTLDDVNWINGDGRDMNPVFQPKSPVLHGPNFGNSLAQINHYALRSQVGFLVKSARGLPNHGNVPVDLSYWIRRNFCGIEDQTLANRTADVPAIDDPELTRLHHQACQWHQQKAQEILGSERGVELLSTISVAGPTKIPQPVEIKKIYHALGRVFGGKPKS